MKHPIFIAIFLFATLIIPITNARTIEIDVHGMTCAFCVDSLERQFEKMKSISKVAISLKNKKIRLETDNVLPKIETIKQTILDAGFTPVKITVIVNEKK